MREVELIADEFCLSVQSISWPEHGQGRTAFVETSDHESLVIKWSDDPAWGAWLPQAVASISALKKRGYPAPATFRSGVVPMVGSAWVQERIVGAPASEGLNSVQLAQALDAIESQADADREVIMDVGEWSWVDEVVYADFAGWWGTARMESRKTDKFCDQLVDWLFAVKRPPSRHDWVNLDMNFSNILINDGQLAGIVDLDHLGEGDRSVDIAHLAFEFEKLRFRTGAVPIPDVVSQLRERVLAISGESGWRVAVAYRAIASLGWVNAQGMRVPVDEALFAAKAVVAAE